jgi:hypothetical protein
LARAAVELATTQLDGGGDTNGVTESLERAQQLASRVESPHLLARALFGLSQLRAMRSDGTGQERYLRQAQQVAARGGDAQLSAAISRALDQLIQMSEHPTL